MILIWCDSKILQQSDRNKSSSFRELLGVVWGITALESEIRAHSEDVVILSDCISLSLLIRQKYHNSRLLEISIFLSSFSNISVHYVNGPSLYFADFIRRHYNMVYLENSESKISQEFSEILPPANKKYVGATLRPEQFTDLCLSKPTADYIDVSNRRQFYDQNVSRYFNLTLDEMNSNIPRELLFLAGLYASWNNENLTSAQFAEAKRK